MTTSALYNIFCVSALSLALTAPLAMAKPPHAKNKAHKDAERVERVERIDGEKIIIVEDDDDFDDDDFRPEHSRGKALPPGLQKKVARGEPLPPGWQKKLQRGQILDDDLYARSVIVRPVNSDGISTVRVGGETIRLIAATREILDILSR